MKRKEGIEFILRFTHMDNYKEDGEIAGFYDGTSLEFPLCVQKGRAIIMNKRDGSKFRYEFYLEEKK